MEQRILGMNEVGRRCRPLYNSLSLKGVIRLPDKSIDESDMPCVLIMEGDDKIIKYANRDFLGYPCNRSLNVIVECWDYSTGDVRNIHKEVRKAVLADKGILLSGVIIREQQTIGPFNLNIPNVLGMRIVFNMNYTDEGPSF